MANLFKQNWNRKDSFDLSKTFKKADDLQVGDIIATGRSRDTIQAVDKSGQTIKAEGRNYHYEFNSNDNIQVFDVVKSQLTKSDRQLIDKEVFKASLDKTEPNPWAICTASVGRESAKFEDCVMEVKEKFGIKKTEITPDEADEIATANVEATGMEKDIDGSDYEEELIDIAYGSDRQEQNNRNQRTQKAGKCRVYARSENGKTVYAVVDQDGTEKGSFDSKDEAIEAKAKLEQSTEKDMGIENAGGVPASLMANQDLEGTSGSTTQEQDKVTKGRYSWGYDKKWPNNMFRIADQINRKFSDDIEAVPDDGAVIINWKKKDAKTKQRIMNELARWDSMEIGDGVQGNDGLSIEGRDF